MIRAAMRPEAVAGQGSDSAFCDVVQSALEAVPIYCARVIIVQTRTATEWDRGAIPVKIVEQNAGCISPKCRLELLCEKAFSRTASADNRDEQSWLLALHAARAREVS